MIGLDLAWIIAVVHETISPCEALLVLTLASIPAMPALWSLLLWDAYIGEGCGLICVLSAICLSPTLHTWFWIQLYNRLPTLGTANLIWFFVSININTTWVRIVYLLSVVFDLVLILAAFSWFILFCYRRAIKVGWWRKEDGEKIFEDILREKYEKWKHDYERGEKVPAWSSITNDKEQKVQGHTQIIRGRLPTFGEHISLHKKWHNGWVRRPMTTASLLIMPLNIYAAEKTISMNGLQPQTDFSAPGQMIPLLIGGLTLVDGMTTFAKEPPKWFGRDRRNKHQQRNLP